MRGWGAPDWGTIPAYLQGGLDGATTQSVCVVNMAQDGYVSTQSLVSLIVELQSGARPNAVVFYDGINDVLAVHESGLPGAHVTLPRVAARFEARRSPLIVWATGTRTFALLQRLLPGRVGPGLGAVPVSAGAAEADSDLRLLAASAVDAYLANLEMVQALAEQYGFDCYFVLQPHPAVSGKPPTPGERRLLERIHPDLERLAEAFYEEIRPAADAHDRLWNFTDLFDDETRQLWFDDVGHIIPEGNRIVADAIVAIMTENR
jgi:hypothetical protein